MFRVFSINYYAYLVCTHRLSSNSKVLTEVQCTGIIPLGEWCHLALTYQEESSQNNKILGKVTPSKIPYSVLLSPISSVSFKGQQPLHPPFLVPIVTHQNIVNIQWMLNFLSDCLSKGM